MSDDAARASLMAVLAEPPIARINFRVGSVAVTPHLFRRAAQGIRERRIKVKHVPGLVAAGIYNSTEDCFYLKRDTFATLEARALAVHEACHAGLDIANASEMRLISSEAAGFLSQCVYARANTRDPENDRLTSDNPRKDRVFEIAWAIAAVVLSGRVPPERDIDALRQAVSRHPEYVAAGQSLAGFNGVPGM